MPAIQIGGRWRIKKSALDHEVLRQDKQGQPTVLVVDDDLGLQDLFRTFLKQIGFSRVVVGTATEAIKSLRKQKFDLMFLDLQLPDAPGDQVYKAAKESDPDLNVIVITGYRIARASIGFFKSVRSRSWRSTEGWEALSDGEDSRAQNAQVNRLNKLGA
jgi:CheY-like chemotaxis protein